MNSLPDLHTQALTETQAAMTLDLLDSVRVKYLGKSGLITGELKKLGALPAEERKSYGAEVNRVKEEVTSAIEARKVTLESSALEAKLNTEQIDVTLPIRPERKGTLHPITKVTEELIAIFGKMGFTLAEGPEIEDDFHNFTALNIPENHPARQMHDTFYLPSNEGKNWLLRTHTSPVQIRAMKNGTPPLRVIAPGRTYRSDSDMTHSPMFHQIEGFVVDEVVHMGHLKWTIVTFLKEFFGISELPVRFRPSFFPFTEPSAEMDIGCDRSGGEIKLGQGSDWLEILGCGMIHPSVLRHAGIDPTKYQGFAFGIGIERLAMLKYGIPDLRTFFESDARWLAHYGFSV